MFGLTKILFCLPLLLLVADGARLDSDAFRRVQPGNPWGAPTARDYACPQPNGYFKHNSRCDEYVKCQSYVPIKLSCPIGLHFNPYMQWTDFPCDHPSRVQCESEYIPEEPRTKSTSTTTTTTTTTPPPPPSTTKVVPQPPPVNQPNEFMCPQPHGYFKHTGQCGEYVECKNYVPLTFTCPIGLHFNPVVPWTEYPCDHPSKVKCIEEDKTTSTSTTTSTTTTTTTTTTTPTPTTKINDEIEDFSCPQPHGYYRHPNQCGQYVECKNYRPLTYTCPGDLHFNPQVSWTEYPCDHPSRVQCNKEPAITRSPITPKYTTTTTTTTTTPPPPPPTTTPAIITPRPKTPEPDYLCPQPYGYYKHSNQCGEYVECKNYVPLKFACPSGLHFNPSAQWVEYPCEDPAKVQCIQ